MRSTAETGELGPEPRQQLVAVASVIKASAEKGSEAIRTHRPTPRSKTTAGRAVSFRSARSVRQAERSFKCRCSSCRRLTSRRRARQHRPHSPHPNAAEHVPIGRFHCAVMTLGSGLLLAANQSADNSCTVTLPNVGLMYSPVSFLTSAWSPTALHCARDPCPTTNPASTSGDVPLTLDQG
jgi:hypothetical protein